MRRILVTALILGAASGLFYRSPPLTAISRAAGSPLFSLPVSYFGCIEYHPRSGESFGNIVITQPMMIVIDEGVSNVLLHDVTIWGGCGPLQPMIKIDGDSSGVAIKGWKDLN